MKKQNHNLEPTTLSGIATLLQPMYPELTGDDVHSALKAYAAGKKTGKDKGSRQQSDTLLTRKEAAERLKVSLPTVNRMLNDGRLTRYRLSSRIVRVSEASIEALITTGSMEVPHNGIAR